MSTSSPGTGILDSVKTVEELKKNSFILTQTTQQFGITAGRNILTPSKPTNDAILIGVLLSTSAGIYLKGFISDASAVSVHNMDANNYESIGVIFSWLVKEDVE